MADFNAVTASNSPKIKDESAVEAIIDSYYFDPELEIGIRTDDKDDTPYLFIYGYSWPEAWKLPAGISPDDFDPYQDDIYEEGRDGFDDLLKEIAQHLEEPLTVQAIGNTKCRFPLAACEWHILPGNTELSINEFQHFGESVAVESS